MARAFSPVPSLHVARLAPQPRAFARRARLVVLILRQFFAHRRRIGFLVAAFQTRNDPFECMLADRRAAALVDVRERNDLLARAEQQDLADVFRQILEGAVDIELEERRQALQHLEIELVAPVPALHRARRQRQRRMRDHPLRIEERDLAEAVAFGARAHRVVEREQARLEFLQRIRADRASELRAVQVLFARSPFRARSRGHRRDAVLFRTIPRAAASCPAALSAGR